MTEEMRSFPTDYLSRNKTSKQVADWRVGSFAFKSPSFSNTPFVSTAKHYTIESTLLHVGIQNLYFYPFSTKTETTLRSQLSVGRGGSTSSSNGIYALVAGGAGVVADKFTWQTQSCSTWPSANLTLSGSGAQQNASNVDISLITGLYAASGLNNADKCPWTSFVTSAQTSAKLTTLRGGGTSASDATYMVYFGGTNSIAYYGNPVGQCYAEADKVDWSTLTASAQVSANLSSQRYIAMAVSDVTNVFVAGGGFYPSGMTNNTEKMPWSTLTSALHAPAYLTQAPGASYWGTTGSNSIEACFGFGSWANVLTFSASTMAATTKLFGGGNTSGTQNGVG